MLGKRDEGFQARSLKCLITAIKHFCSDVTFSYQVNKTSWPCSFNTGDTGLNEKFNEKK